MKLKKILLGVVGLAAVASLAACGNSNSASSQLNKIKSDKVIKVALEPDYPPFEYQTVQDGKNTIVGADIDLANAIGKKLGVKVQIQSMDFNNVLASLQTGKADIAISGISATSERKQSFDFSDIYYDCANEVVVKKSDLDKYKSMSDFKGVKLAAQKGSTQEQCVQDQLTGSTLVSLPSVANEVNEVKSGQVQGAVMEDLIAKSYVAANPDLAIAKVNIPNPKSNPGFAVALPKGSTDLEKQINEVISELKSSGEMEKIIQKNYAASQNN